MNIEIKSLSEQGPIRSNNEDAIFQGNIADLPITFMIIADGMGGHNAGEVASSMLVEHIKTACDTLSRDNLPHWPLWISEQLNIANLAILAAANQNTQQKGMGTTGVLAIIDKEYCHIGWIGDSRAYSLKSNSLKQETVDHTMIQELVNKGAITEEMAKKSNTKNMLSQAIGIQAKISVDTVSITVNNGDMIMLSTDGLHDYLDEDEIHQFLSSNSDQKNVCDDMVKQAIANNSRDNLTVGLIRVTQ